ncbi:hypothetical protein O181_033919 [Austropuccinia psidii MF-1]|uniref:Uncharacterized protein n=1 Tax=Austropuccinia psidii MF-1 TaxID=1389203 RepID=A0A9Q3CZP4_9BASI|nr:hypothetical protein [Austropuccinia psidii MF-1]
MTEKKQRWSVLSLVRTRVQIWRVRTTLSPGFRPNTQAGAKCHACERDVRSAEPWSLTKPCLSSSSEEIRFQICNWLTTPAAHDCSNPGTRVLVTDLDLCAPIGISHLCFNSLERVIIVFYWILNMVKKLLSRETDAQFRGEANTVKSTHVEKSLALPQLHTDY